MAVFPSAQLQTVQTYQRSSLALLQNLYAHIATANMKFKDFDKIQANLGSSVTFDLPPRARVSAGLVASFEAAVQRVHTLTADQSNNASFAVTAQDRIFNLEKGEEDYMRIFGKSFIAELATNIEENVAKNWDSSVPVGESGPGLHTESGPYRFFGNGSTAITSYQQLSQMHMLFRNYGAVATGMKAYVPDTIVPDVVGSGINQFVPNRNDAIARSWEIGNFGDPEVKYYRSNLLPQHISGNTGVDQDTLVVVSTNDPTGANITQITVSGSTINDANAVFSGDLFEFQDGVSGQPDMRYLTFIGHNVSANRVQVRVTTDASADGSGNVVLTITPALNSSGGRDQNLNNAIVAGMELKGLLSHRAGGLLGDGAFFLALPQLPEQSPFPTANESDPDTGASLRLTYGSLFGQNQTGMIYDEVHGSTIVPEYSMRIVVPLSQG